MAPTKDHGEVWNVEPTKDQSAGADPIAMLGERNQRLEMLLAAERATVERLTGELATTRAYRDQSMSDARVLVDDVRDLKQRLTDAEAERDLLKLWASKVTESHECLRPHAERLGLGLGDYLHKLVPAVVAEWKAAEERAEQAEAMVLALRDALEDMVSQYGGEETCLSANEGAVDTLAATKALATALKETLRAEVVEECAKLADEWGDKDWSVQALGTAIRALLSPAPREEEEK